MIKQDKISVPSNLKEKLFCQGGKIKKLSREMLLKSLTLAYESFFLHDIENMITETFATELNQTIPTYGLISLSRESKTGNKLHLISPNNKLKYNLKEDVFKNKIKFELDKVYTKTSFSATRDNVLNFGILCTEKKQSAKNEQCCWK